MTEARVFTLGILVCLAIALICVITRQWFGVIGSVLGAGHAYAALYYLVRWKPGALVE
jgi:hypothetical protein